MSSSDPDDDDKYKPTRRQLLRGVGAAGAVGTAGLANSTFNITDRIARSLGFGSDYAERDEVEDTARDEGRKGAEEAMEEEFESNIYIDIDTEDFQEAYEHVRDELNEADYGHTAADSLHDALIEEDPHYNSITNGELEDGLLEGVDLRYGESDAIDSKIRYEVKWGRDDEVDRESVIREELDDNVALAFRDALYEVVDDDKIEEEYTGDNW